MISTGSFAEEEDVRNLQRVFEVFAHTQEDAIEEDASGPAPIRASSDPDRDDAETVLR
jgi:hypothetical protein